MTTWRIATFFTAALLLFACKSEQPNPLPQQMGPVPMQQMQPVPGQQPLPVAPVQQMQQVPPAIPITAQPQAPAGQPQNPLAGLAALGQMMGQGGQQAGAPVQIIPWQSLSQALPTSAPGWALQGQIDGESVAVMGISMAQASCKLNANGMHAEVSIMDNPATAMVGMAFAMAPTVDSSTERMSKTNISGNPAIQTYHKQQRVAELQIFVRNRLMVTVKIENTDSEAYAIQLAQQVNYTHLGSLIGG